MSAHVTYGGIYPVCYTFYMGGIFHGWIRGLSTGKLLRAIFHNGKGTRVFFDGGNFPWGLSDGKNFRGNFWMFFFREVGHFRGENS